MEIRVPFPLFSGPIPARRNKLYNSGCIHWPLGGAKDFTAYCFNFEFIA